LENIQKNDGRDRLGLIELLGKLGARGKDSVPVLAAIVKDYERTEVTGGSVAVRTSVAVRALGNLGANARDAVPALISALGGRDILVASDAARALGKIGPDAKEAVLPISAVSGRQFTEREGILIIFNIERKLSQKAVAALTAELRDRFSARHVAEDLASLVASLGPEAKPSISILREGLKNQDGFVRRSFAKALGKIGPAAHEAVPALAEALRDPDFVVRGHAATALGEIGSASRDALEVLRGLEKNDPTEPVRQTAALAVNKIQVREK
jgi:HEAT repeat protein